MIPVNDTNTFVCSCCGQCWNNDLGISVTNDDILCINCFKKVLKKQKNYYDELWNCVFICIILFIFCSALCFFKGVRLTVPALLFVIWISAFPVSLFCISSGSDEHVSANIYNPLLVFIVAPLVFVMVIKSQKQRKKNIEQNNKVLIDFNKKIQINEKRKEQIRKEELEKKINEFNKKRRKTSIKQEV